MMLLFSDCAWFCCLCRIHSYHHCLAKTYTSEQWFCSQMNTEWWCYATALWNIWQWNFHLYRETKEEWIFVFVFFFFFHIYSHVWWFWILVRVDKSFLRIEMDIAWIDVKPCTYIHIASHADINGKTHKQHTKQNPECEKEFYWFHLYFAKAAVYIYFVVCTSLKRFSFLAHITSQFASFHSLTSFFLCGWKYL